MNTSSLTYQRATARWFALPLATILFAVAASIVQAKTFNVATLAELNAALNDAQPGDNIVMADGAWRDAVINLSAQATAERPVTLRAQTPGKVFLTGASKISLNSPFLVVDGLFFKDGSSEDGSPVIAFKSHHGRITNTAIVNFNPASGRANSWVLFDGEHNRLDHCFFEGNNNRGPLVANSCCQSRHHRVESCYFKDIVYVAENGREIIQVQGVGRSDHYGKDGAFFIIEGNLFERADGEGAEIISIKSNFNIIRYNTIRATRGGITARSGYATTIEGNFIFGDGVKGASGIRVQGHNQKVVNNYIEGVGSGLALHTGEHLLTDDCKLDFLTRDFKPLKRDEAACGHVVRYGQVRDSLFAHNTFVNNTGVDIELGIGYKSRWPEQQMVRLPENNIFANNLIYKPAGGTTVSAQAQDSSAPLDRLTFRPNQFQANIVFGGALKINPLASGATGFISVDPKLGRSDGIYRPASSSPVINVAVGDYAKDDLDGQPRNKPDIGADEVSGNAGRRRPLTPRDVGTSWMKFSSTSIQ